MPLESSSECPWGTFSRAPLDKLLSFRTHRWKVKIGWNRLAPDSSNHSLAPIKPFNSSYVCYITIIIIIYYYYYLLLFVTMSVILLLLLYYIHYYYYHYEGNLGGNQLLEILQQQLLLIMIMIIVMIMIIIIILIMIIIMIINMIKINDTGSISLSPLYGPRRSPGARRSRE